MFRQVERDAVRSCLLFILEIVERDIHDIHVQTQALLLGLNVDSKFDPET